MLAFAGFVEECWNAASGIGSTDINHPRLKRTENRLAIIQELLGGPAMSTFGHQLGFEDRSKDRPEPFVLSAVTQFLDSFKERVVFSPAPGGHRFKKLVHFGRHLDPETFRHR